MRHRYGHRRLSRNTKERRALLRGLATDLLHHEHIVTTVPKAKEVRPIVERLITVAKRGVKAADPKGRTVAATVVRSRRSSCLAANTTRKRRRPRRRSKKPRPRHQNRRASASAFVRR